MGTAVSDQVSTEEAARAIRNLADLYERYAPWLARRLRRAGATCVEDLVQETYLRIATYSTLGRSVAYPKAMLLTVATNLSKDWAKKRYKRQISEARRDSSCVNGHHVADAEHSILIKQIILGLPEPLRDRIVVGEMRDGAAALETLKSWNTGHPGGLSTLHANSAEDVLRRLEDLIGEVMVASPRRLIARTVDRLVHVRRTADGRRIDAVLAVDRDDRDGVRLRPLA